MPPPPSSSSHRRVVLIAAFLGWMFDGMEMAMFPLIARPALAQMHATSGGLLDSFVGHWMGVITAMFLVGAAIGGGLFGWLGDRIGRVRAMSISILCYSIFTGAIFFARTPLELGVLRFLAAFGMGGEWSLGVALVMEVWSERHRSMLAGLIGAANSFGYLLLALTGASFPVTTDTWRTIAVIGAVPALLVFWIVRYVPESESWQRAAAERPLRPFSEIAAAPLLRYTIVASILAAIALIGSWGSVEWLPLWADKLAGPIFPTAKAHTQAVSAVAKIIGALLGAWVANAAGRRWAYFIFCASSLACCAWLFRGVTAYGSKFLVLTFVVGVVTTTFYGWLPLYLPELYPTRARATGQGIVMNAGRVFAALGALQMGSLMRVFEGSYARAGAIITLVYGIGLVLIWYAPETKGRSLLA